ncbi:MAG: quinohemoprotein amine dehydrogenase maturation protein [Thiolinea sp.]
MSLYYQGQNAHALTVDGAHLLFHVPTTSLFEMDHLDHEVLALARDQGQLKAADLEQVFRDRVDPQVMRERIQGFRELKLLDPQPQAPEHRKKVEIREFPLTTMVLNVNTGCNLACRYCYKEDLAKPSAGNKMAFDTARQAIELLLKESPDREHYNIVFFGGEPLSNMPLIREVVSWADQRLAEIGAKADYSLTTNATLLTEELVDWLDAHRFGLTVSMDGPKTLHDLNRLTVGGKGSYDVVAAKARMLLARYRSRPVGARVTLTAGVTDVMAIWDHLRNDLGFQEVGFSPVTAGSIDAHNLDETEVRQVFERMKQLGEHYVTEALAGRSNGFSNMHQLMTDLWEGRSKALPCGAGLGMLAVDHQGGLNLCHRFTGSEMDTFGTVTDGIKKAELGQFLEARAERSGKGCATCRIRNLCAGGCYHESYVHFSDPMMPTYHYCELMRDWVDFGIAAYARILKHNPDFFPEHIAPRRSFGK